MKMTRKVGKLTNIIIIVIINRIMDGDLKPDNLLCPSGHSVVKTDLVVTIHVSLLRVTSIRVHGDTINNLCPAKLEITMMFPLSNILTLVLENES